MTDCLPVPETIAKEQELEPLLLPRHRTFDWPLPPELRRKVRRGKIPRKTALRKQGPQDSPPQAGSPQDSPRGTAPAGRSQPFLSLPNCVRAAHGADHEHVAQDEGDGREHGAHVADLRDAAGSDHHAAYLRAAADSQVEQS